MGLLNCFRCLQTKIRSDRSDANAATKLGKAENNHNSVPLKRAASSKSIVELEPISLSIGVEGREIDLINMEFGFHDSCDLGRIRMNSKNQTGTLPPAHTIADNTKEVGLRVQKDFQISGIESVR
jgi:hypothetical protein